MNDVTDILDTLLGTIDTELTAVQMVLRAAITFVVTIAVVRLGSKRLFGKGTAYDTVVAIMIGSVMSRAITGSGSGSGTMLAVWAGGLTLIVLHWLMSWLSYHVSWFGPLVKGNEVQLVEDGEVLESGMVRTSTTEKDLNRAMRASGHVPDTTQLRLAYMERDGNISVVPRSSGPTVLEVSVQDGVQTVRISLG